MVYLVSSETSKETTMIDMMTAIERYRAGNNAGREDMARAEGIALGPSPQGLRPIFQRDMARWIELGAIDSRSAEEIASDEEYRRAAETAE